MSTRGVSRTVGSEEEEIRRRTHELHADKARDFRSPSTPRQPRVGVPGGWLRARLRMRRTVSRSGMLSACNFCLHLFAYCWDGAERFA